MANGIPSETNGITSGATLLPCPFCGGEARAYQTATCCWSVECSTPFCGCEFASYGTEAEAVEAWNVRSVTAAVVMGYEVAKAEHTCELDGTIKWDWDVCCPYWQHELSCGHVVTTTEPEPPNYCDECGAKVMGR